MTGFHLLIWPLIYVQLLALKAWVRAHYGRGVPYCYEISPWGRVRLYRLPTDCAGGMSAAIVSPPSAIDVFHFAASPRLALALGTEPCAPVPAPHPNMPAQPVPLLTRAFHPDTS